MGGANDGVRMVVKHGKLFLNKSFTLYNLQPGQYKWSVQAIDASYEGSAFATEAAFNITGVGVKQSALESRVKVYSQYDNLVVQFLNGTRGEVYVYSITGQEIAKSSLTGDYSTELLNGIYLIKIKSGHDVITRKIIINK